jgi:hypothetical protein
MPFGAMSEHRWDPIAQLIPRAIVELPGIPD